MSTEERVLRRQLKLTRYRPSQPRELKYNGELGLLTWKPPVDKNIPFTHYRIRINRDSGPPDHEVSSGQISLRTTVITPVFISAYNANTGVEGPKAMFLPTDDSGGPGELADAENVTLGEPQIRYTKPDEQGKVYVEITVPVTAPEPIGTFTRNLVQLQAPDDAGTKSEIGPDGTWTIPKTLQFTADAANDRLNITGHPFVDGNTVRVRNLNGELPFGLSAATLYYYVVNASVNWFQVSLTLGGGPVAIATPGTGQHYVFPHATSGILPLNEPEVSFERKWKPEETVIKVTHKAPPKTEQWRIYVASGNVTKMNPVVRADQDDPTPSVLMTVNPPPAATSGVEYAPNALNLQLYFDADITINPTYNIDRISGRREWWVMITWDDPVNDPRYPLLAGYELTVENLSTHKIEVDNFLVAGQAVRVYTTIPREVPAARTAYRIWLVPRDTTHNLNKRVDGVTASIDVNIVYTPKSTGVGENAPKAVGFAVIQPIYTIADGGDGTYTFGSQWFAPDVSVTPELGGYDLILVDDFDREEHLASFSAHDGKAPGSVVIWYSKSWPVPPSPETYTVRLVSYDTSMRRNALATAPYGTFTAQRQSGASGREYTALVSSFDVGEIEYTTNAQGQKTALVPFTWVKPSVPTFGGVFIYLHYPARFLHDVQLTGIEPGTSVVSAIPYYPNPAEYWEFYALSVDTNNRPNIFVPGITPSVILAVGPPPIGSVGSEYTGRVTGFNATTVQYEVNAEGQRTAIVPFSWNRPTDSAYGGMVIYLRYPARFPTDVPLTGVETGDSALVTIPFFPDPAEDWEFYALSVDVNNQSNTYLNGYTPAETISIGPAPLGSNGVEYTPLVISESASIQYRVTGEGIEEYRFSVGWTNPSDPTYGGPKIVVKRTSGTPEFTEAIYRSREEITAVTAWRALVLGEVYSIYIVSIDANNRENDVVDGVTPRVLGLAPVFQTTGSFKFNRGNPSTLGGGLDLVSGVLRVPPQGITAALMQDFAVSEDKLANAEIIGAARIKYAAVENVKIDRASVNKLVVVWQDVVSLAANTIMAGTIAVSISMTAPDLTITAGTQLIKMNATDIFKVSNSATLQYTQVGAGFIRLDYGTPGGTAYSILSANSAGGGLIVVNGSSLATVTPTALQFNLQQVVGPRAAAVTYPAGGAVVDTECRASLVQLLDRLRLSHGLIS